MEEITEYITVCSGSAVLTSIVAFLLSGFGLKWFKDWVYQENEFEAKARLVLETFAEEHSTDLKLLLNRHLRRVDDNDEDFRVLLTKYSHGLHFQIKQLFYIEGVRLEARKAWDALFHLMLLAVLLIITSFVALALQINFLCWVVVGAGLVVILWQCVIGIWLRKLKHYADDKILF